MSVSSIISVGNWAKPTNIRLNSGIFAKNKVTKVTILWDNINPPSNMNVYWELKLNDNYIKVYTKTYTFIPLGIQEFTTVKIRSIYRYNIDTTNIKTTNLGISDWSHEIKITNNKDNYCEKDCKIVTNKVNVNGNANSTLVKNNKNISSKSSYSNVVNNKRQSSSYSSNYKSCFKLN